MLPGVLLRNNENNFANYNYNASICIRMYYILYSV